MLHSLVGLERHRLLATDGEIGRVRDFLVDDHDWTVRYLVARTSGLGRDGRDVLISPISFGRVDADRRTLALRIAREQVRTSPDIDTDRPVSRQHEADVHDHYDYRPYWRGPSLWGLGPFPGGLEPALVGPIDDLDAEALERERAEREARLQTRRRRDDPHLRSVAELRGYRVHATDGDVRHVTDALADPRTWAIRHLVVQAGHWWRGNEVLVSPASVTRVDRADSRVALDLTREWIRNGPRRAAADGDDAS